MASIETGKKNRRNLTRSYRKKKKDEKNDTIIMCIVIVVFVVFLSFIFSSKTFLKRAYENKYMIVNIPFFTFFVSDENNVLEVKTTKSILYLNQFYEEHVFESPKFNECDCDGGHFFYNPDTKTVIYGIDFIEGKRLNTVKIKYSNKSFEEICFGRKI